MNTSALIADLHNADDDVRWKATERLAGLGSGSVDAILQDVAHSQLDEKLRQSYLYVFEQQWDPGTIQRLKPVSEALHGLAFREAAPVAAENALRGAPPHLG